MEKTEPMQPPVSRKPGTVLMGTAVAFAATAACIVALEGGIRLADSFGFMKEYDPRGTIALYSAHPTLNHTITPNLDVERPAHIGINIPAYHLKTNSLGFRFEEARFTHKDNRTLRIAVLGDSQVEGFPEELTLPFLLERRLANLGGWKVETMNFGSMSYSPLIHYVNLKTNVLKYRPDLVILHFDLTDVFDDNVRYKDLTTWDENGNPRAVGPSIAMSLNIDGKTITAFDYGARQARLRPFYSPARARIWLLENSKYFLWAYAKVNTPEMILDVYFRELAYLYPKISTISARGDTLGWCKSHDDPKVQEQIAFSFGILDKIRDLLKKEGIPLLVTTIPNKAHLTGIDGKPAWSPYPIQRIRDHCRKISVPFYCPIEEFKAAAAQGAALYYSDNMHLDAPGQVLWAESLAKATRSLSLKKLKILKP